MAETPPRSRMNLGLGRAASSTRPFWRYAASGDAMGRSCPTRAGDDTCCHKMPPVQWSSQSRGSVTESMNILLPEPLKAFVDSQISPGRYSSASEYVRELICPDEKRKAEKVLESLLLEGLKDEGWIQASLW